MAASLYDRDFYSWTEQQAKLLRSGQLDQLDVANLAEEIETLGRSATAALRCSYQLIAIHLLKMIHQPQRATASWENTVNRERLTVEMVLADNPGPKPKRHDLFLEAYRMARREAAFETRLPPHTVPSEPPFDVAQAEAGEFWPPGFPSKAPPTPGTPQA